MRRSRAEQRTPAVTQFTLQMRGGHAMPVGHVLPMPGQFFTEGQQGRLLKSFDALEHLAFGVGGFQGDVEVVQEVAQQGAIEQAQRFSRMILPKVFGAGGDVGGQGLATEIQAERLLRQRSHGFFARLGRRLTNACNRSR